MNRKLCKSENQKMVCGVCGGIAEFLNVDPTIIRLLTAVLAIMGPGVIAYIAAALIMPYNR